MLKKYQAKRDFSKTPEPEGNQTSSRKSGLIFVVQEHHASRLHFDFRLELDGVLKSWAVPKGPSMDPKEHHLAVMVEDHPLEYAKFHGTIPEGNYGAGEVLIWDKGTYEPRRETDNPEAELRRGLAEGHLTFVVQGKKLKGEFALIKLQAADKKAWLLVKKGDKYAIGGDTIEPPQDPKTNLKDYPQKKLPKFIKPMLCQPMQEPFSKEGWLFELKWDGFRAIGAKHGGDVQLYSRNGLDFSKKFAIVAEAIRDLPHDAILDGEVVVTDKSGNPHFEWLQNWNRNQQGVLHYYVFDILQYEGRDIRAMPLINRKKILKELLARHESVIRFGDHVENKGESLFKLVQKKGIEGMVAKRAASQYQAGVRNNDWLKIKTHLRQEVVIGGYTEPRNTREYFGSLLVGVYDKGELIYVGHSGGGIPDKQRAEMLKEFKRLEIKNSPFQTEPTANTKPHWVKPDLVCELSFAEWTKDGSMRQPEFEGLRPDKNPKDVKREVAMEAKPAKSLTSEHQKIGKSKIVFTHLDKIFWPEHGYTKGDLAAYYEAVSKFILPYLKDRPLSLKRQPEGYAGMSFFQKDITIETPPGIKKVTIHSGSTKADVHYMVGGGEDTLLYMVQLGCIEINPWSSRVGQLEKPDWAVMDLDPVDVDSTTVVKVAQTVHEVCTDWKIPAYPKTSGKKGIHIFVPLGAKYSYAQARDFIHLLAVEVNARQPEITSLVRTPSKRGGKVYLDYLQNSKGQTLASPYSVRPTKDASVSTPLKWDEVKSSLRPEQFTIQNMPDRLKSVGDLWKPVIGRGINLEAFLRRVKAD